MEKEKLVNTDNVNVNHPNHYNSGKYEVIDVVEDWKMGFNLGNAIKYISRAGKKNPEKYVEDLEKALFYISREIKTNADRNSRNAKGGNE